MLGCFFKLAEQIYVFLGVTFRMVSKSFSRCTHDIRRRPIWGGVVAQQFTRRGDAFAGEKRWTGAGGGFPGQQLPNEWGGGGGHPP